jgi:hypothetical protein
MLPPHKKQDIGTPIDEYYDEIEASNTSVPSRMILKPQNAATSKPAFASGSKKPTVFAKPIFGVPNLKKAAIEGDQDF